MCFPWETAQQYACKVIYKCWNFSIYFILNIHYSPDKFSGTLKYDDTSLNLRSHPAQAWLCNKKEDLFSSEHAQFNSR